MFARREVDAEAAADIRHGRPLPPTGVAGPVGVFDADGQVLALVEDSGSERCRRQAARRAASGVLTSGRLSRVQRWRGLSATPTGWGRCVVTIGVYDGVHLGHRKIIGRAVERAREVGQPSVVVTFDPHPSEVLRPGSHPAVLSPPGLQGRPARRPRGRRAVRAAVHAGLQPAAAGRVRPRGAGRRAARERRGGGGELHLRPQGRRQRRDA